MIIQAVSLLEDLDKELNNYAMRLKEWYSWHFPELAKIVTDNIVYAKAVQLIGMRTNVKNLTDEAMLEVLPEEIAEEVREAAEISMGTEILQEDEGHLKTLANQVVQIGLYRQNLAEYLKNRMAAIAPNLTQLVGELVGAKLISHSGSLMNLAKQPASTIQILGAEKALFRALKTKKATPKYGLIYSASIVG
jgi:nucleolar protein 58